MEQMKVGQCRVGMVMTNCYGLLNTETKEMILVDPGDSPETIEKMVAQLEGRPVAVLLTHGHYDHILAVGAVKEKYQIPVYACREESIHPDIRKAAYVIISRKKSSSSAEIPCSMDRWGGQICPRGIQGR